MIKGILLLDHSCGEDACDERADFRVTRTNDELPANYVQWGTRSLYYCAAHMPEDARVAWFGEEDAEPGAALVKPYDGRRPQEAIAYDNALKLAAAMHLDPRDVEL